MTMTIDAEDVVFSLTGSGDAVINWGDGSELKIVKLTSWADSFSSSQTYTHTFSEAKLHTISINGQNTTRLNYIANSK